MRKIISLNHHWKYAEEFEAQFLEPDYNDGAWEKVNIPHTTKEIPYNYFDEKEYQIISTYRKEFTVDRDNMGKRIFVDFGAVMAYAEIYLNGEFIGSHKGGYTPFSFDLTEHITFGEQNVLAVKVDSTERSDIPPFGYMIDYLCFGGIYREVNLRIVDPLHIKNIFAKPQNVLQENKEVETTVFLANLKNQAEEIKVKMSLSKDGTVLATMADTVEVQGKSEKKIDLNLEKLTNIGLWDVENPNLYDLTVQLQRGQEIFDSFTTRIGFREAIVKEDGFYLNGKKLMLRGLNRHQSFPYVGYAMPKRVQRKDADILKYELGLNLVRTSHYPQSTHFLDRCDEIGLLVFEEIPGWQHIGDEEWKEVTKEDVKEMIERDWNHPSIFLWGVRINESEDDDTFYEETNRIARELDPTRQTGGVRFIENSKFLEDVYTMNDFIHSGGDEVLRDQKKVTGLDNYVPYMVCEFNGHMYPTKRFDQEERLIEHALRHLRVHNAAALDPNISAAIGWCAFDYNTHFDFGAGDRICYHGVMDMFRIPKMAAHFYSSQRDPEEKAVLEPATLWARGERSIGGVLPLVIFTNCDEVEVIVAGELVGKFTPAKESYPGVKHPPVIIEEIPSTGAWGSSWYSAEFVGYLDGKQVVSREFVKNPVPTKLLAMSDDHQIDADGIDATRIIFKLVDQAGNLLPYSNEPISIEVEGEGNLIGPDLTGLIGGCIGAWVRSSEQSGKIKVTAKTTSLTSEPIVIETTK
ncbi:MAG: glycoside hydrolase family 2 TIM barrel-domain containing protein [Bacillota bacterium]|nr:glycoside hydrolase family 2 TIM barrel-domain containing protein [Bacillota bacterium]